MGSLEGKTAIVTGGNGLLGKETATTLAEHGAEVIITCRNPKVGNEAATDIRSRIPGAKVSVAKLDLVSQDSVREFANEFKKSGKALHILVANAGANISSKRLTPEGVPLTAQVNYLGHYTLARLLEPVLISSAPSRIVSVSSVTHRFSSLPSSAAFLSERQHASYGDTKLAQVYFTYEAQRRLSHLGVNVRLSFPILASAVDPGGVRTNIWKGKFARPPISWYVKTFLAPPSDGAKAVVHAATADYQTEVAPKSRWPDANERRDLRFYAKGAFASPLMTRFEGPRKGIVGTVCLYAFMLNALLLSLVDWPVRNFSNGRFLSVPRRCLSSRQTYDPVIARDLWDLSADIAKVPAAPQAVKGGTAANGK